MVDSASEHHAWRPPADGPPPTEALAGYTDLVVVGRGGESVVYRAREPRLGRDVAVKVLLVDDAESSARFAREIEITVGLGRQHPNIVTVLDTGTTESGRPAIVMEYYDGGTLNDRLREQGPFPPEEVVRIGLVLSDALAFAHDQGFLHRDVKPQNVLVLPTSWVLADFGIARLVDAEYTSSVEAFTYRHASPQILDGHPPTPADDIWSLGSTLYTLLEGRAPFASDDPDDDSALAYLRRARTEPHRPFSTDAGALGEVISRCLVKDVTQRWASVKDVHHALLRMRHGAWEPGAAWPVRAPVPGPIGQLAAPPLPEATRRRGADDPAPLAPRPAVPVGRSVEADGAPPAHPPAPHEHTHLRPRPDDEPDPGGSLDGGDARPPRRRRAVALLGVLALVVGSALGLAGALLRDDDLDDPQGSSQEQAGLGTTAAEEDDPGPVEQPQSAFDPALAFRIEDLRADAGEVTVEWNDPSEGIGWFHISQTSPEARPVQEFDTGVTEATFTLSQPPGRPCFVMVLHMPDGSLGRSDQRCVTLG
ncbi:serine/threonine-protein kinase [Nocardioides sp. zg-1228]|uniref:serine/threonine-protein kinase n=1 Tax=Nocardioides sp. zg-1228 TaxID=2763008 RepID=UPI00164303E4|nr:serine/threonine-protein kinase [Nocardioides sp. zg-1228]MBC2933196.1 serine/threonine protein kinase [Nocardioides sp. zg-1228]QSF56631.1 serine/threonine protein kinase [Nocardioides sp. zg-1228]